MNPIQKLKIDLDTREEETLSRLAALSAAGIRRVKENKLATDYRQQFTVDVDRILHSLAYTRYIDKTQVFYLIDNDHITHRVLHVQLVSKVARTIGRFLRLNEDLIEAIALGHDIGHPPFGHEGESFLSELCRENGIGAFHHNVQSVRCMDEIERKGSGWNLCLQTLDGILCHDGETHNISLEPLRGKTFDDLDREMAEKTSGRISLMPMTLEGCVVRMADTIAYIGRDIEDAIRLGLIDRTDIPPECVDLLGDTNGTIVYNLVTDVIGTSHGSTCLAFSPEVSKTLVTLKQFNYQKIYLNPRIKTHKETVRTLYRFLYEKFCEDLEVEDRSSVIYTRYLDNMAVRYTDGHRPAEIVRDFLAGMTDRYFLSQCPPAMRPGLQKGLL
jgi:dGTPase